MSKAAVQKQTGLKRARLIVGERAEGESDRQVRFCNEYLRMGPGRSLSKLSESLHRELAAQNAAARKAGLATRRVPTQDSLFQICKTYSAKFSWVARARAYDASLEEARTRRAHEILNTGMATPHGRVHALKELADELLSTLKAKGLYGKKLRSIRESGEDYRIVHDEVFRSKELRELRGLLDDLAQETGGRVQRHDVKLTGIAGILSTASAFTDDDDEDTERDIEDAQIIEEADGSGEAR